MAHVHEMKLRDYQHVGVDHFVNDTGPLNTCVPGTGKTAMAIRACEKIQANLVLVVCPSSLKYNWEDEWKLWSTRGWDFTVVDGAKAKKLKAIEESLLAPRPTVIAINYESIISTDVHALLKSIEWDVVIADEVHRIKNPRSQTAKAMKLIKSSRRWGLTGTPAPNGALDIWSIIDWIRPGHLHKNFYAFRNRYAVMRLIDNRFKVLVKYQNEDELADLVNQVSYRVTKEEALDLPDKVFKRIPIEMGSKQARVYKDLCRDMIAGVGDTDVVVANNALTKLLRLQQVTSGFVTTEAGADLIIGDAKVKVLKDLIKTHEGESVVVFCRFRRELEIVCDALQSENVKVLSGGVPQEERQEVVRSFQNDGPSVLVAMAQVAGVGLTLTAAAVAIYYSRSFSFLDHDQTQDRIHRIGQDRECVYYDLVCRKTVDEHILKALTKKQKIADKITGDDLKRIMYGL